MYEVFKTRVLENISTYFRTPYGILLPTRPFKFRNVYRTLLPRESLGWQFFGMAGIFVRKNGKEIKWKNATSEIARF